MSTRILASFRDALSTIPPPQAQTPRKTASDRLVASSGLSTRHFFRAGLTLLAARGVLAAPTGQRSGLVVRASTLQPVGEGHAVAALDAGTAARVLGTHTHRVIARSPLIASDAVSRIAELAAQINALQAEISSADPADVTALEAQQLALMQEQSDVMAQLQSGGNSAISVSSQAAPTTQPAPTTQTAPAPTLAPAPAPAPGNLTGPEAAQWKAAQQGELQALQGEQATSSTIAANYAQAGIRASVSSALPPSNPSDILNDSLAQAAEAQMQANYVALGSMDLAEDQIGTVYASAIRAAASKTGVPANVLTSIIWTESKGHPLTANGGLGQIDPVAWGQMADANPALINRYTPADNIMAAAMYMAVKAGQPQPTTYDAWMAIYHADYQG